MQEADYGMTQAALGGSNGRNMGDETLLVKFFMHPMLDQPKSTQAGRPIFEERVYIQIMQPGNKDSIIIRPASDMDKTRFPEHFRKFEAKEDQDAVTGTLLSEWPMVTRSLVEELKFFNVVTVEQLAEINDSNAQTIRGINELKRKAALYLESAENSAMAEQLDAANQRLDELTTTVEALMMERDEALAKLEQVDEE